MTTFSSVYLQILDAAADAEVERMKEMMEHAFQEDVMANQEKLPATGKLRLLPQVMDVLQKCVDDARSYA